MWSLDLCSSTVSLFMNGNYPISPYVRRKHKSNKKAIISRKQIQNRLKLKNQKKTNPKVKKKQLKKESLFVFLNTICFFTFGYFWFLLILFCVFNLSCFWFVLLIWLLFVLNKIIDFSFLGGVSTHKSLFNSAGALGVSHHDDCGRFCGLWGGRVFLWSVFTCLRSQDTFNGHMIHPLVSGCYLPLLFFGKQMYLIRCLLLLTVLLYRFHQKTSVKWQPFAGRGSVLQWCHLLMWWLLCRSHSGGSVDFSAWQWIAWIVCPEHVLMCSSSFWKFYFQRLLFLKYVAHEVRHVSHVSCSNCFCMNIPVIFINRDFYGLLW